MTGGNKLSQGNAREIFVEEKFHPPGSGFDGFHGRQFTREFQTGANTGFRQRGIIFQNFLMRLSGGDRADDVCNQNPSAAHDWFAVTYGRIKRDLI